MKTQIELEQYVEELLERISGLEAVASGKHELWSDEQRQVLRSMRLLMISAVCAAFALGYFLPHKGPAA